MFKNLPALLLLASSSCTIIYSQKAPETPKQPEKAAKPTAWNFQFEGGSYLGIEPQEVTRENFAKFGLSEVRGVAVGKVLDDSPAAQAGLQAGDVVVRFDGDEVESVRKLTRLIAEVGPDHQAKLTVLRGGGEREIAVTMGKREFPQMFDGNFKMGNLPEMKLSPKMSKMPKTPRVQILPPNGKGDNFIWKNDGESTMFFGSNRQIGVSVSSLTKQLGEYFGIPEGRGLLISNVRENSPAAKAGLKAGDVIVEADGREVKGNVDLVRAFNEKKEGQIVLTIIRDKNRQNVSVTPETVKGDWAPLTEGSFPPFPEMNFEMKMPVPMTAPVPVMAPAPPLPGRVL